MTRGFRQICGFIGFLFMMSLLDGFVSGYLEPKGICRVFSGHAEVMSGTLPLRITDVSALAFMSQSPLITVEFIEVEGNMWRGMVQAADRLEQGEYPLKVYLKEQTPEEKGSAYRVLVFQDESAYRSSFYSVFRKYLGISPWWATAATLPMLLLSFAFSFRLSVREEALLNAAGLASIFKVTRKDNTCNISFGLGREDGISTGDLILILDRNRQVIGDGRVKSTADKHATAAVDPCLKVEPNFLVEIPGTSRCSPMEQRGLWHADCAAMEIRPADLIE
jgi:hypothetical protein